MDLLKSTYQRLKEELKLQDGEWVVVTDQGLVYRGASEKEALRVASRLGTECYFVEVGDEDRVEEIPEFEVYEVY